MKLKMVLACVCLSTSLMLSGCSNTKQTTTAETKSVQTEEKSVSDEEASKDIFAMDTYMSLTAYGSNSEEAVSKAVQEINRLDAMFSVGNEDSDVTKINENGSGEVSEETAFIMNRAMQV